MTEEITNIDNLRSSLADELKRVSSGDSTPAAANAFANLSGKILGSIKLELEYNKMCGSIPKIDFIKQSTKEQIKIEKK